MRCQGFFVERFGVGTSKFITLHSKEEEEEEEGKHTNYLCVLRFGGGEIPTHRHCDGLELSQVYDFAGSGANLSRKSLFLPEEPRAQYPRPLPLP